MKNRSDKMMKRNQLIKRANFKSVKGKKGIELSVNFIVVLILAIVTLSMGIVLTYNIFSKAYKMKTDIDAQTKSQINSLLDSGEQVAIPVYRIKVRPGKSDVFGLGILNTEASGTDFKVKVMEIANDGSTLTTGPKAVKVYDKYGKAVSVPQGADGIKIIFTPDVDIEPNKQKVLLLVAGVDKGVKSSYTYSYTVKVTKGSGASALQYGFPQKIYVEVI